jgi:hypothetical protein
VAKRERRKGQTIIYKTLHRKLKIGQHEPSLQITGKDNAVTDIAKHKKKTNVKVGSECGSTLPCSLNFSDRSMVNIKQASRN